MSNINYNLRYEVFGQSGFEPFRGIRKVKKPFYYKVTFDTGQELKLSEKHRLFLENGEEIYVKDLTEGTRVLSIDRDEALSTVLKVEKIEEPCVMYDVVSSKDHTYYTGNILSHNCDCLGKDCRVVVRNIKTNEIEQITLGELLKRCVEDTIVSV